MHPNDNSYKESWYYKKHQQEITVLEFGKNASDFWKHISNKTGFQLSDEKNIDELIFDWNNILPHYNIPFDYVGCEKEIERLLLESILSQHEYVLFDIEYSDPIFKVKTEYFIKNWDDFISANHGMGSVVCSENFDLLLEFTNDHSYLIYSNFSI